MYTPGEEELYLLEIDRLDSDELRRLFRLRRDEALYTSRRLVTTFAARAGSDTLETHDVDEEEGSVSLEIDDDADSTFDTSAEEESLFDETEDESSGSEDDDDASAGEDEDTFEDEGGSDSDESTTDSDSDGDDSTYIEDSTSDGDGGGTSLVEDIRILGDLHTLMKQFLEHNAQLCLIQFVSNKRDGKENDGPSLIRAMVPWTLASEDRSEIGGLLAGISL